MSVNNNDDLLLEDENDTGVFAKDGDYLVQSDTGSDVIFGNDGKDK